MDNTSSSSSKTVGIVIVVAIIVVGIWLMIRKPENTTLPPETATSDTTMQTAQDQTAQPQTPVQGIQTSGSSDTALASDSASIDSQIQALGSDNSAVNQPTQ